MNCRECEEQFDEFLDARLTPSLQAAVREHIAGCSVCAPWREMQRTWELLGEARGVEPSAGFVARAVRRATEGDAAEPLPWWILWPRLRWQWVAGVAVVALLAIGMVWVTQRRAAPPETVMLEQQQLLNDLPMVADLDLLLDLDVIERLDALAKPSATQHDAL